MKKNLKTWLPLLILTTSPCFASDLIRCSTADESQPVKSYSIVITKEAVAVTDISEDTEKDSSDIYYLDDPGIYSLYATATLEPRGNDRLVHSVRFDLGTSGTTEEIARNSSFEMGIAFGWFSLRSDQSGSFSDDTYRCKKL